MLTIYLAAPWVRRAEARVIRDYLVSQGFSVPCRWLDVDETRTTEEEEAVNDLYDIEQADILVVLNLEKSEGKAFEQGYAYSAGKPVYYVGDRLNVFQTLMQGFPTVDALIAYLRRPLPVGGV